MKKFSYLIILFIFITGCGGGGGNSNNNSSKLISSSIKNRSVKYNYITLKIDNISSAKARLNGKEYLGVKNNDSIYIYNIMLKKGKNNIELILDGGAEKQIVQIFSEGKGIPPISVSATKREGFGELDTVLAIDTTLNVNKYLLDKDGDGIIDDSKDKNSFKVKYTKKGRYFPIITVQTVDGTLYSSQKDIFIDVKSQPKKLKIDGINEQINDLERFGGYIWALSNTAIYKIDENNESNIETIFLFDINNPQGFCYDDKSNIYVVDSGGNRVVKLLASSNYQPDTYISQDGSFGKKGSGKGEFKNPVDCMVDSTKDNEKIYVVDSGNDRIQIFNKAGIYLKEFDASDSKNGKLKNPQGILASSPLPIICDSGNNIIREFDSNGKELAVSTKGLFNNPLKISRAKFGYLVTDNKDRLAILSIDLKHIAFEYKLNNNPIASVSFRKVDDNYFIASKNEIGLEKLSVNSEPIGDRPEDITKKYLEAILYKKTKVIKQFSSSPKLSKNIISNLNKWIDFLSKYEIKDYKLISKDQTAAGVEVSFKKTTNKLQVILIKYYGQWFVDSL